MQDLDVALCPFIRGKGFTAHLYMRALFQALQDSVLSISVILGPPLQAYTQVILQQTVLISHQQVLCVRASAF